MNAAHTTIHVHVQVCQAYIDTPLSVCFAIC